MNIQEIIIDALEDVDHDVTMTELISNIHKHHDIKPAHIKAAVLPLIITNCLVFTDERKLRINERS